MGQKNLPLASGDEHTAAFSRAGWSEKKRGNHITMAKDGEPNTLSIPNHREVKRGLLAKLIKAAGMTEAEYLGHFEN